MKKVTLTLAALSLVVFYAGTASAQCAFNYPAKAKGVKGSMVRAFNPCPSTEVPVVNTETEGETEACTPVLPRRVEGVGSSYDYDTAEGSCDVQTQAKLVKDCSKLKTKAGNPIGIAPGACHVTFVKGKCKGIKEGGSLIGPEAQPWSLQTLSRATLNDATNGDMTVIDFPVAFLFDEVKPGSGQLKLKANSAQALAPLVGKNNADLPACTSIEIVDVIIKDPDGLPFARLGGSTFPEVP